ncbi:MAG TPA: hypothetical protein VIY48_17705 [Candidatus Paceibacterota bacterium]
MDTMDIAILLDIDGTLTMPLDKENADSRGYFDWDRVSEDRPNSSTIYVVSKILGDRKPVIITGRKEQARSDTVAWLRRYAPEISKDAILYMRPDKDNRPAVEYKKEVFEECIRGKFGVLMSFDDDPSTSKMWASLGIPTFQVLQVTKPGIELNA